MSKLQIPEDVMEYFRKTGAMGGRARAKRHTREELAAWGRLGGRPRKDGKRAARRKGGR